MTTSQAIVIGLLAVGASIVAGLLGAGGDILYVPLLLYALPAIAGARLDVHTITGLSLVQSLVSTGGGGARHYLAGRVDTSVLSRAWPMLALGALTSGLLSRFVSAEGVLVVFALVSSGAALLLFTRPPAEAAGGAASHPSPGTFALLLGVGLLAGAAGVGAGFLIIAILLHRLRVSGHAARATGLVLTVCTAAPALGGKVITGQIVSAPVPFIVAGSLVGSLLGSQVSPLLPARAARWALASLVVVLSARVWLGIAGVAT